MLGFFLCHFKNRLHLGKTKNLFFSWFFAQFALSLHYVSGKADSKPSKTEFNEWTVDSRTVLFPKLYAYVRIYVRYNFSIFYCPTVHNNIDTDNRDTPYLSYR